MAYHIKDVWELNLTEFDFALSLAVQIHNPLFYSLDLLYLVFWAQNFHETQNKKIAKPFRPQVRNCFNYFFSCWNPGYRSWWSHISTFSVFLTEQIASRIPVYEARNCWYKFPIRVLIGSLSLLRQKAHCASDCGRTARICLSSPKPIEMPFSSSVHLICLEKIQFISVIISEGRSQSV